MRIYIINDDLPAAVLLASLLDGRNGDVVLPCAVEGIYDRMRNARPDLIILDLVTRKPEGGWDILTFLQLHPLLRRIPVIVCSGETDELLAKEDWLRDHGIGVVIKPFDLEDLYRAVECALVREKGA